MKKSLLTSLPVLLLSGCINNYDYHGHLVEEDDLAGLSVGESSKEDVVRVVGTPSSVSTFHDNQWYYIAETREKVAFFSPRAVESQITILSFDDAGILTGVEFKGEDDKNLVAHVKRETPTSGHSFGFFEQMFGNIGRFGGKDPDAPGGLGGGGDE